MEIRIEKRWQAVTAWSVLIGQLLGCIYWAHSVYLELRDSRIAQQNQLVVVSGAVEKMTVSIEGLTTALNDHEKRLMIHDIKIQAIEKRGERP